jgi:Ser/Thr protein kinase RdoA (MazF antagonist)
MTNLIELVQGAIDGWDGRLEADLFGTDDPREVAERLASFCAEHLADPVDALLYVQGVGLVAGFALADGRTVVIKVHRWNTSTERLTAMQEVQTHLADRGLPMPRPLLPVHPLGNGLATVEEHLDGDRIDGRTPAARRAMAEGLHRLLEATRDVDADVGRHVMLRPDGAPLWSEPHSLRFDFEATAEGAEWIDALGEHARARLDAMELPDRIGHLDWRVQNLAFSDGDLAAIYDCDSIGKAPEPVVVGAAAGGFCIDWEAGVEDPPPTVEEMRAFVADYETARGAPFDEEERDALDAANLMLIAYGARSQHSDLTLEPRLGDTRAIGWFRLLRDRGERCF